MQISEAVFAEKRHIMIYGIGCDLCDTARMAKSLGAVSYTHLTLPTIA